MSAVLTSRAAIAEAEAEAEAVATFSGPEDAGLFLIRAVQDPDPAYRRVLELP